ncbi:MAG: hypothetical protein VX290_13345, partial [Candidatus Latescibacterota bacterium]|nr:hypothetical protein [Candidatus Latescibacterota bacterium]
MTSSRIVFVSTTAGEMDIWTMRPDGSDRRNLTQTPFASDRTGQADIHAMGRDESDQRPLEASDAGGDDSAFSTDGQWLPCTSQRDGETAIYIMRADGTQARRVTPEGFVFWQASFSPDASQLVFT